MPSDPAIRPATPSDTAAVESFVAAAFPPGESAAVASLAAELLAEPACDETFTLVAESSGRLPGHVCFSRVTLSSGSSVRGSILAPLAVHPDHQRRGLGTALVEAGLCRLREASVDLAYVYGDPSYYVRFGFRPADLDHIAPPYPLTRPTGWQCQPLQDPAKPVPPMTLTVAPPLRRPELW